MKIIRLSQEDLAKDGYPADLPRNGDCYEAAGKLLMDSNWFSDFNDLILVHADITPIMGALVGITHDHAWIEKGDTVLDHSNNRKIEMPKDVYYSLGRPKNIKKYTYKEMARQVTDFGHWGPWQ